MFRSGGGGDVSTAGINAVHLKTLGEAHSSSSDSPTIIVFNKMHFMSWPCYERSPAQIVCFVSRMFKMKMSPLVSHLRVVFCVQPSSSWKDDSSS